MARFRGTDKESFIDESQMRGGAIRLLDEAMVFAQRHLPVAKEIVEGRLQRVETPLIPWFALREIMVNALIHRDYSIAGGAVSLAIFDDRLEVWSTGTLPAKVTAASLSRRHGSHPRNPFIAEAFYRAGLIEKWGRGTNRVIETCRRHGIAPPTFEEVADSVLVTFHVHVGTTLVTEQVTPHETPQVTPQVAAILEAAQNPRVRGELQTAAGLADREHFRTAYLAPLVRAGWLEMTIPGRPRSRLQRYRTTEAGLRALRAKRG
jgi:ATP-dependent DNA helicase RecG